MAVEVYTWEDADQTTATPGIKVEFKSGPTSGVTDGDGYWSGNVSAGTYNIESKYNQGGAQFAPTCMGVAVTNPMTINIVKGTGCC